MATKVAFTITAAEERLHPDHPETHVVHAIASPGGPVAVGMSDSDCRATLAGRAGPGDAVLVKKGALGRSADETTTVAAIASGG